MQYMHGVDFLPEVFVRAGEWACEEALWGSLPILTGPLVAHLAGCELVALRAKDFHTSCKLFSVDVQFLVAYGECFIKQINMATRDEEDEELLFNSVDQARYIVSKTIDDYT